MGDNRRSGADKFSYERFFFGSVLVGRGELLAFRAVRAAESIFICSRGRHTHARTDPFAFCTRERLAEFSSGRTAAAVCV